MSKPTSLATTTATYNPATGTVTTGNGLVVQTADFTQLYNTLETFFQTSLKGQFNAASIPTLTNYAMELVETGSSWSSLSTTDKRNLVLGVAVQFGTDLINDPNITKNMNPTAKTAITTALELIPTIITASAAFAQTYSSANGSTSASTTSSCACLGC
jgi:hypothetical protein